MDIFGKDADPVEKPSNKSQTSSVKGPDDYGNFFGGDHKLAQVGKPDKTSVKQESESIMSGSNEIPSIVKREEDITRSDEYGDIFGVEDQSTEDANKQPSDGVRKKEGELGKESTSQELNNGIGLVKPVECSIEKSKTDKGTVVAGLKKRSRINDRVVKGVPTVDPYMFRAMEVSEPESDDEKNYPGIYDNELNSLDDKPWREADADITDWFNYGFDEDSWRAYCAAQVKMRLTLSKKKHGGGKDQEKTSMKSERALPKNEGLLSPSKQEGLNVQGMVNRMAIHGICFDFEYKGYCSRTNCKWKHTRQQSDVRKPTKMPLKTSQPHQPAVGAGGVTPRILLPFPQPINQGTRGADVQNFMEQLRPVSSLMHPGIIGRVQGSKKRKRSRRSRSRSRTRR